MSWLNYHHLMYFKTIATEGSISKASEKLMVGQPALSAQLKQLEEYFDQKLFERRNRKLFLTDAGKATLKYANQIFNLGSELQEVIKDKSYSQRPHLNIGSLDSVPKNLTVKVIETARKIQNCHITALDGTGDELLRQLDAHSIDIAITNYPFNSDPNTSFYSRSIGKYPISLYASKKYEKLRKGFPESIQGAPIILPTAHSKLRHDVDHYFELNSVHPEVVAETQDTIVQKLLAVDGYGLIAEPEFAVKSMLKAKQLVKIGQLTGVNEEFYLISAKRIIENPVAAEILKNFKLDKKYSI